MDVYDIGCMILPNERRRLISVIVKISNFKSFLQIAKNDIFGIVHFFKTVHAFYTKNIKNTLETIMLSFSYFSLKSPY